MVAVSVEQLIDERPDLVEIELCCCVRIEHRCVVHVFSFAGAQRFDLSSTGRVVPIGAVMPSLIAMLVASLAGWLVESPFRAMLGPVPSMAASLLVGAVAFFYAKRFVSDLRGGS